MCRRQLRMGDDPFRLRWRRHPVADPTDGADQELMPGPKLGAKPPNVYVDGTDPAAAVLPPRLLHQPGPGECLTGVQHKEIQ